jgi:hypothetical protein
MVSHALAGTSVAPLAQIASLVVVDYRRRWNDGSRGRSHAAIMIQRVEIKNFRSCVDVSLDGLGPVVVLAGRNGVGKSNILKAISWAAASATSATTVDRPSTSFRAGSSAIVTLSVVIGEAIYIYYIEYNEDHDRAREGGSSYEDTVALNEQVSIIRSGEAEKVAFERQGPSIQIDDRQPIQLPSLAIGLGCRISNRPVIHQIQ